MAHEVFLSYASADEEVVEAVCDALEERSVRCWLAPRDLSPGVHYAEGIITAINQSRLVVLVLSANATCSAHVPREVERAGSKNIPILSIRMDKAPLPPAMEYFLSQSHWLDASGGGWERHLPRLVEAAAKLLEKCPPQPPKAQPAPGRPGAGPQPENLLHLIWDSLDPHLQDAFALAYNKKRREGSTRISTRDFFQALVRLRDDHLAPLLDSLPADSLPEPVPASVSTAPELLEEAPLLSDCVAESLARFKQLEPLPRKIGPADIFVDVAKHGHGPSVARLRHHGIGPAQIDERVKQLGLSVLGKE
jgi:hypothetical protein